MVSCVWFGFQVGWEGEGKEVPFCICGVEEEGVFFVVVEELVLVCLQELCPVLLRVNDVAVLLRRVSNNMCSK